MEFGSSEADAVQGSAYQSTLAVFEARGDLGYQDVTIEEPGVAVAYIVDVSDDRTIELSLFSDIFHRQERGLSYASEYLSLLIRKSAAHKKTHTPRGPRLLGDSVHPTTSRNNRTISASASFKSASISSSDLGGVYS